MLQVEVMIDAVHEVTVSGTIETTGAVVVKTEPEEETVLMVLMPNVTVLKAVIVVAAGWAVVGVMGIGRIVVWEEVGEHVVIYDGEVVVTLPEVIVAMDVESVLVAYSVTVVRIPL